MTCLELKEARNYGLSEFSSTFEVKELSENGTFEGYASVFGEVDNGMDRVEKGAFKKSVRARGASGIKMLWQHNPDVLLGVWEQIKEDTVGLFVKGRLAQTEKAKEVYELMKVGALDTMSIGFKTISDKTLAGGVRSLKELDLWEISLVTFPMLKSAKITGVKSEFTKRDVERVLRDAGMPNGMATKLIASGWDAANTKPVVQRDAGDILTKLKEAENLIRK